MKRLTITILSLFAVVTTQAQTDMKMKPPVSAGEIDMNRFTGTWYEISRMPSKLEDGLTGVTVVYKQDPKKQSRIHETFIGYKDELTGKQKRVKSKLSYEGDGVIKGPLGGNYYVLAVDPTYQHFLMGTENRKYLWIMSRTKDMDNTTLNSLYAKAKDQGYATEKMEMTKWK